MYIHVCVYIYIYIYIYIHFGQNPLRISYRQWLPFITNYWVIPKAKAIFLLNHSKITKARKLTVIQHYYLIFRTYSNFSFCPNNVLYREKKKSFFLVQDPYCIELSYLNSGIVLQKIILRSLKILRIQASYFAACPSTWVSSLLTKVSFCLGSFRRVLH